jgi:hypothetical protein
MTSLFGGVTVLPSNAAPVFQVQEFIPTAGQTVFTLTQFSYTLGGKTLWVLVNGQKQVYNVDYTETSANSFTMTSALGVTDLVEVITFTLSNVTASTDAAAASASSAAASAAAALVSLNTFKGQYYGIATSDPSVDPLGLAPSVGDLYFNSLTNIMRVYGSTGWANVGVATPITVNIERFSGTGSQTVFTLANAPAFQNACEILISGVGQTPGVDYTVTGVPLTTLTFTTAPPAGTLNITVRSLSAYAGGVPNDLSVSTSKLVDLAVTTAKINDLAVTPAKMANAGYEFGMRNRIINGGMAIDQRNAGASVPASADGQYTLDRWVAQITPLSKFTVQQNAGAVTPPAGFKNYLGVTSTSSYTVAANEFQTISQIIEGLNFYDMAWGTANAAPVTISFWVRSSLTGVFGGTVANMAQDRSYPFSYTITAANTWELKTVTIAGDTTGSWLTTNAGALRLRFGLGVGSTYSGTVGLSLIHI